MAEWWEERTTLQKIGIGIGIGLLIIGAIFLFGLLVKILWNWLMPDIFGLPEVTYWQAWGLLILSMILIKGFGGGSSEGGGRLDRKRKKQLREYIKEEIQADSEMERDTETDADRGPEIAGRAEEDREVDPRDDEQ